jgi:hypothetical protein
VTQHLEQIGLDTIDAFLNSWNSRNAEQWAHSLNYPHVRPSPFGPIKIAPTREDYIARVDYQKVIESGWDHSEWDYQHLLHLSPRKIHVAGQWSRYSVTGEAILSAPIVYVCTLVNDHWGVQSRFGADFVDENTDTTEMMSRGLGLIQDFVNNHKNRNQQVCAELLNYPHYSIGIGELDTTNSPAEFNLTDGTMKIDSLTAIQTGQHSLNASVDLQLSLNGETQMIQGIVHVNDRDGHLGIQAWSWLIARD